MIAEPITYVFRTPEGSWRIAGTRVSLDSVVVAYWRGESPEEIVESFPALSLEQVHGAIASYLRNRPEIDQYMKVQEARWDQFQAECRARQSPLLQRIRSEKLRRTAQFKDHA